MPRSAQKKNGIVPVKKDIVPMKYEIARPSLAQTFKEGLAFGAGSSIAQTLIRTIVSPAPISQPTVEVKESKEYNQCMIEFSDKAACAHLLQNA
jgi:hypothetical protein